MKKDDQIIDPTSVFDTSDEDELDEAAPVKKNKNGEEDYDANDLENDDDVDELGKKLGVHYDSDEEELNLIDKVPVTTKSDPPENDQDDEK